MSEPRARTRMKTGLNNFHPLNVFDKIFSSSVAREGRRMRRRCESEEEAEVGSTWARRGPPCPPVATALSTPGRNIFLTDFCLCI